MYLLATQYSLSTMSLDVYFAGCKGPHCKGCHNPESWSYQNGRMLKPHELVAVLKSKIDENLNLITSINFLGGEPLDQNHTGLHYILDKLSDYRLPMNLYTRYEIYDVPFPLRIKFNYIKTGRYIEELKDDNYFSNGLKLASTNQKYLRRGYDY